MRSPIPPSWTPALLSLFRIVASFLFMAHGTQILFGVPTVEPKPPVALLSWSGMAGIFAFFGGGLLFLGIFTRLVAFILAGEMAVAYFKYHASGGFWPILNHGELSVFYCFAFLYLSAAGGGPWTIDALFNRAKGPGGR